MSLEFSVYKLHCEKDTLEWGKDEAYFLILPILYNSSTTQWKRLNWHLSEIYKCETQKTIVNPLFTSRSNSFNIETEDADQVLFSMYMFEADNQEHYRKLLQQVGEPTPETQSWIDIITPDTIPTNQKDLLLLLMGFCVKIVKRLTIDDLIDNRAFIASIADRKTYGQREYPFKGCSAKYRIGLTIK